MRGRVVIAKDWTSEINALLDELDAEPFIRVGEIDWNAWYKDDGETPDWAVVMMALQRAAEYAGRGNIEPLRQVLLDIAGQDMTAFLRLPPLGRGEKFPKADDPVLKAALDYKFIMRHYRGRKDKDHPTGADVKKIVAARHKVAVDQVASKLQNPRKLSE
jgi:hypothetical protein